MLLALLVLLGAAPAQGYVRLASYNNVWQSGTTVSAYLASVVEFDTWCWYQSSWDCLEWYTAGVYGVLQRDGATVATGNDYQNYSYPAGVYLYNEIPPGGGNFYDASGVPQAMWHGDYADGGASDYTWQFIYVQPMPPPPPSIYDMYPSEAERGSSGYLTISGQYLSYATGINVSGTGVSMYASAILSDNQIEAGYSVNANAGVGTRTVTVTTSSGTSGGLTFNVTATPTVNVSYASIPNDRITVELAPAGLSGTLTVQVVGATTHTVYQGTKSAGTHDISFNIPNLPNGEFTQVRATWAAGQGAYAEYSYRFRVLGDYNHSKYNVADHSANCTGSLVGFTYLNHQTCNAITCSTAEAAGDQAFSGWLSEVSENGAGLHPTLGIIWKEPQCTGRAPFRRTCRTCPACLSLGELVANEDVAISVGHPYLSCGDSVYVHGLGVKTVKDRGGGVGPQQLDHFIGITGCNQYGAGYGTRKTVKLF